MKVQYDKEADAAYIYVKGGICKGEVKRTVSMSDNMMLDFDEDDKLIGIEIFVPAGLLDDDRFLR